MYKYKATYFFYYTNSELNPNKYWFNQLSCDQTLEQTEHIVLKKDLNIGKISM